MYVLGIETTGPHCSVALVDEKGVITEKKSFERFNHLKSLAPLIDECLKERNIELRDLDAIAVSKGPGSFTGIRIGVSTARAISQVLGTKLIGVPTLQAFGYRLEDYDGVVCPILDARREQVYASAYKEYENLVKDAPYGLSEFLELLSEKLLHISKDVEVTFVGDGVAVFSDELDSWERFSGRKIRKLEVVQDAKAVANLGKDFYDRGMFCTYEQLLPDYMRIAEAQRQLDERLRLSDRLK